MGRPDGSKPNYAVEFSKDEIAAEERKPKKKHAVMIGYSGTGYKGMQLNDREKTIEGELFGAMVAAGAISKANADDPKKSSWVRCARTDKGVHAAGNVLSVNLITKDKDIVQKINDHLSSQITVYGIERTNRSFNAYHFVDSRIYEYLIPTHCFAPPHPRTFLGKTLAEIAQEQCDSEGLAERQAEVADFWQRVEDERIRPILEVMDDSLQSQVLESIFEVAEPMNQTPPDDCAQEDTHSSKESPQQTQAFLHQQNTSREEPDQNLVGIDAANTSTASPSRTQCSATISDALKKVKGAYQEGKFNYRIDEARLARVREVLRSFNGTKNYHNYTVHKNPKDSSAKRHMKSVTCADKPFVRNGTEWLSLRFHGQSFMMHQIRKMVSMAALIVRCGAPAERIRHTLSPHHRLAIPKAPGVGLLLERPVFDAYNERSKNDKQNERNSVGLERFEQAMEEFKQKEIYTRIFDTEPGRAFHQLFLGLDTLRSSQLLYLSSQGVEATKRTIKGEPSLDGRAQQMGINDVFAIDGDAEDEDVNGDDGEG